jgi:Lrp/AsnC family leucine-responsive transcriptional regulator
MSQIDAIDGRILSELQANGRLTMKALAERVGLSSPAMIERVRRLEDRGVIAGYRAIVPPAALGRSIAAYITASVESRHVDAFLASLRDDLSVVECHRVAGAAAYLLKVQVADMAALEELADGLGRFGATCEISIVLSSPIPWREVTSADPAGSDAQARRRRRMATRGEDGEDGLAESGASRRGAGRPRTRPPDS